MFQMLKPPQGCPEHNKLQHIGAYICIRLMIMIGKVGGKLRGCRA